MRIESKKKKVEKMKSEKKCHKVSSIYFCPAFGDDFRERVVPSAGDERPLPLFQHTCDHTLLVLELGERDVTRT